MAAVRRDRPGYLRLEASVPQCGHSGVPEVLLRFQAAVLGMGSITGPNDDDIYVWRAGGAAEAQAAIALMWPHLGSVKRFQAANAMRAVRRQYDSGSYKPRAPRRRAHRPCHIDHLPFSSRTFDSKDIDLAWAAGFMDGEGHFGLPRARARKNAPDWRRIRVSATQNGEPGLPPEVLFKLQRLFGGSIEIHGEPDDFRWLLEGPDRVESVFLRVRPWLGHVKQIQAWSVMERFRSQIRVKGDAVHCVRGHEYTRVYVSRTGPKKRCNACARIVQRKKRAEQGIKPRPFKNVARRYNF